MSELRTALKDLKKSPEEIACYTKSALAEILPKLDTEDESVRNAFAVYIMSAVVADGKIRDEEREFVGMIMDALYGEDSTVDEELLSEVRLKDIDVRDVFTRMLDDIEDKDPELKTLMLMIAAYDSKAIWNEYAARGIDVAINIISSQLKKNVPDYLGRIRSHGSVTRGKEMARILKIGRDEWKREKGYGRRWKVDAHSPTTSACSVMH